MHSSSYRRPLSLHRSAESGGRFGRLCANLGGGLSVVSLCIAVSFALPLHTASAAPTSPADPGKVLRYVIPAAETGFDPAMTRDLYSQVVNQSVFEPLFTYDYLARPAKLVPLTAEALPEVSADGKTYTIRLKKGIYFSADPAFNGKRRELTMADYVYSYKRLLDPILSSPQAWLLEGKVIGLDELATDARKTNRFNYDSNIHGLELLDRYTLRINLKQPDFNLGMILAHQPTGAMAREVVEKYRDAQGQVMANPVGTGAYLLTQWVRGSRIVLSANPDYRGYIWDFKAGSDPDDQRIVAQMQGKHMPQIGRIEISVMVEDQSRWLAFQKDEIDLFQLEGPLAPQALLDGKLKPELIKKGIQLSRIVDPEISYTYWNMRDPILGGMSKEKIALRRAIAMAHNVREEIKIVWNDEAIPLEYPIPPGVIGYDPNYKSSIQFEPDAANALLDKFGYKVGKDGWRTLPDGKPLQIRYTARADSLGQQQSEMWKKTYDLIHIHMLGDLKPFPDILKAEKQCQLQTRTAPWIADYPDGDNFMQLFYGPNIYQNNNGCSKIPEYDTLYAESQKMPASPERDVLYHKMARILEVYAPIRPGYARYRNMLAQPRVIGFKKHPILPIEWMYFDIEKRK
ncbi:ABC transporter substrate-binding protein [Glaciimonas sp. Gout2]|uniref:ABC transporter substrate-binding protein n=1 Tax=Glaciimonas sp. Gout2 TaxID=3048625 RepID=UPI002B227C00|nr:ABC transporter substrate-binding protein [Glaciimonas sp. Gout2]MEB0082791.1 ABC transporter substrate-binding protein [Glaciimonas sp. Gout2]